MNQQRKVELRQLVKMFPARKVSAGLKSNSGETGFIYGTKLAASIGLTVRVSNLFERERETEVSEI